MDLTRFGEYKTSGSTPVCGCYVIRHIQSGRCYVGSTDNLRRRRYEHSSNLRLGKHRNHPLQKAFDVNQDVEFLSAKAVTLAEAKNMEQDFLDLNFKSGALFNLSPDASVSFKGLRHSEQSRLKVSLSNKGKTLGVPKTAEHRAKIGASNKGRAGPTEATMAAILKSKSKPVQIHGVTYSSISNAARELNLSISTIFGRVKNSSQEFEDWFYVEKV